MLLVAALGAALACGGRRDSARADGDGDSDVDVAVDGHEEEEGLALPDDLDDDGIPSELDCNDCNAGVGPGLPELCGNDFDEDCDGAAQACDAGDSDGDGHGAAPAGADCDDGDRHVHPGAPDRCGDGVAQDCAADLPCTDDADGDRFQGAEDDCDDTDPGVHPWAAERCDAAGTDEDCDGQVNEVSLEPGRFGCILDRGTGQWSPVDFQTDVHHCGRCRNDCLALGAGTRCTAGRCE